MALHHDEVRARPEQVRALLDAQCPQWAGLDLSQVPLEDEGTDHVLFRLGEELLVRLPKIDWAADQATADARWLPMLAQQLPVSIPAPLHLGEPGAGFGWQWTVVPWIPGETPPRLGTDDVGLAADLADFTRALHALDTTGGPAKTSGRGAPLALVDADVQEALERLANSDDGFSVGAAREAWQHCRDAGPWAGEPVWIHGDLQPGNLIVARGSLAGVIDFGALGVGDPAPDLAAAFWTFSGDARGFYREALAYDSDTWLRACGWALAPSLTGVDYYRSSFPRMAEHGRQMVRAVLAELS